MIKFHFNYDTLPNKDKVIKVIAYQSEPSADGSHISASSVFNAFMVNRLTPAELESLFSSLIPALTTLSEEVEKLIAEGKIELVH